MQVMLTSLWMRVVGPNEFCTRYPSAFAGTLSIAVMYVIGRQLFSGRVGLVGAVLLAVSEFQILHSQETRYYALFLAFTLLSFFFYTRAVERRDAASHGFHAMATIAMFYTHQYGFFVIVAQGLHFIAQRWPLRRRIETGSLRVWIIFQLVVLLSIAPALRLGATFRGTVYPLSWLGEPSPAALAITVLRYVGSRFPVRTTVVGATTFLACGSVAYILALGKRSWLASVGALADTPRVLLEKKRELALAAFWLLCPTLIPWVLSKLVRPIYEVRYTIGAAPALYLLLAVLASTIHRVVPAPVVLGFVAILVGPGLHEYYVGVTHEDWRGAAHYVDDHAQSGDAIVVPHPVLGRHAFGWYYQGQIQECTMDRRRPDSVAVIEAANQCSSESSRVWLVYRAFSFHGTHLEETDWRAAGFRLVELSRFRGVPVYLFERVEEDGDSSSLRRWHGPLPYASSTCVTHSGRTRCRPRGVSL
jgi:hypothetical protein